MRFSLVSLLLLSPGFALAAEPAAGGGKTQLTWYGHAAFKITTPSGKTLLVDPWIKNPANKSGQADLDALQQVDLILISHGHFDHVGDGIDIAKKTKAKLVATFDLASSLAQYAGYPREQAQMDTLGNAGGELTLLDGEVKVTFVPAVHSSGVAVPDAKGNPGEPRPGGSPGGFVIEIKGGPTIYHTGDTDVFADMATLAKFKKISVMLACIGDHFTMGPDRAAEAVKLVGAATVVPMHFGTFPVLTGSVDDFKAALKKRGAKAQLKVMQVRDTLTF